MMPSPPPSFTCPIIIGRDREIGLLCGWLDGGGTGFAVLAGEPGIGKTRLVRETAALARRGPAPRHGTDGAPLPKAWASI